MKVKIRLKNFWIIILFLTIFTHSGQIFASDGAILQGLDKVTARIQKFQAPLNQSVYFGSLRIRVRACFKRPPEEFPESSAFLEIIDERPGQSAKLVFSGWMFASSPSLSSMEHAVYDVWVVDCINL
tara:strand:+ start:71 stop:451 length:381 start_codon:yes stop_codon:yes gene_type:complete